MQIGQDMRHIAHPETVITLTPIEWDHFQDLLLDPPAPNTRLMTAFAEHARVVIVGS
jgi:hypothetical protein